MCSMPVILEESWITFYVVVLVLCIIKIFVYVIGIFFMVRIFGYKRLCSWRIVKIHDSGLLCLCLRCFAVLFVVIMVRCRRLPCFRWCYLVLDLISNKITFGMLSWVINLFRYDICYLGYTLFLILWKLDVICVRIIMWQG